MFQGQSVESLNRNFKFDPASIDFVLLTHAHMDHSGLLPKLFREGFKGNIYSTRPTIDMLDPLLYDSAKIQSYTNDINKGLKSSTGKEVDLLYDSNDVHKTLEALVPVEFDEIVSLGELEFKYIPAGHILGAASILIEVDGVKIIFSGDLGRREQSLIRKYDLIQEEVDYVVMESLYGGITHLGRAESEKLVIDKIVDTANRYGNVIIPVFAVHRSQEFLLDLKYAFIDKKIPMDLNVYLDGPLAIKMTEIYSRYLGSNSKYYGANEHAKRYGTPFFSSDNIYFVKDHKESLRLARGSKKVILAGSGMCDGGRILNHLPRSLKKEKNAILFVGYQADGTLGREIVSGKSEVSINKRNIKVRAEIEYFHGFSAHADHNDLKVWLEDKNSKRLKKVFLTHADIDRSSSFAQDIIPLGYNVEIPDLYSEYNL
jgi:metallo-beta-lactamase family protein